jgi:hypothetical protein
VTVTFDLDYKVPQNNAKILVRAVDRNSNVQVDVILDGRTQEFSYVPRPQDEIIWDTIDVDQDIEPGSHAISIAHDVNSTTPGTHIDIVGFIDDRYYDVANFDNTVNTDNGYLNDPTLYPDVISQPLATASSRRFTTEGSFESTWSDTSNNQFIEISPDGTNYTRFDNTASSTFTFGSNTRSVDANLALSNYPPQGVNAQNATPRFGYNGQSVSDWFLFIDPGTPSADDIGVSNARALVDPSKDYNRSQIAEAGLLGNGTLLTHHQLAEFSVPVEQNLISSEETKFTGDN